MSTFLLREEKQEVSIEKRYFITNLPRDEVARIAHAIRSHWVVENGFYWTLDMVYDEDRSRKRVGNAAENYSLRQAAETQAQTCCLEYGRIGTHPLWLTGRK